MKKQKATWKCNDCINHRYECLICHKMGYDANYYEQMIEQGLIEEKEGAETLKKKLRFRRKPKRKSNDDDYEASSHVPKRKGGVKQNPLIHNPDVVFKCLVKTCGRFYHVECIQNYDYGSKERFSDLTKFRCPSHFCCTCHETGNTKHLVQCMLCSHATHVSCLNDKSGHRISKLYYLCSDHSVPKGTPTWDPNKKKMITDDGGYGPWERKREERRNRTPRPHAEKPVYEEIHYDVPIEKYTGNWCRYCGARRSRWECVCGLRSSGFMKGPWGPKTLCVVHYVSWFRTKKLDLSAYVGLARESEV